MMNNFRCSALCLFTFYLFHECNKFPISHSGVLRTQQDFPGGSDGKASVYNAGHPGSIPRLGRSPGEGNGNPLQYYCLENPMNRGAWQATVRGVAKSRTRLSDFTSLQATYKPEIQEGGYGQRLKNMEVVSTRTETRAFKSASGQKEF